MSYLLCWARILFHGVDPYFMRGIFPSPGAENSVLEKIINSFLATVYSSGFLTATFVLFTMMVSLLTLKRLNGIGLFLCERARSKASSGTQAAQDTTDLDKNVSKTVSAGIYMVRETLGKYIRKAKQIARVSVLRFPLFRECNLDSNLCGFFR